jgi:hypothetical protein
LAYSNNEVRDRTPEEQRRRINAGALGIASERQDLRAAGATEIRPFREEALAGA